ncbi:hypothetical protein JVU11DRAFT_3467 [Chiua virens]|nr:hypothetical protein JVU11DRAFT_3467 [Chiua virens]
MSVPCWMMRLYNRLSSRAEWRRKHLQHTADMDSPTSSFYYNELNRALSEQSFGLTRYEVAKQCSPHEATAAVTLLEGTNIKVSLNTRGYQLDGGQTYESIEGLLQSISSMYGQKRDETIIARLQGL